MSVTQLDGLLLPALKSAANSDASESQVSKPNWSACEIVLSTRVTGKAVDAPNWRETLHRNATNRSTVPRGVHGRTTRRGSVGNERSRRGQVRQLRNNGQGAKVHHTEHATSSTVLRDTQLGIGSNASATRLQYSPVVSLCDILKFKPHDLVTDKSSLEKDQYMNYLNLHSNRESHADKGEVNKYTPSHPRTLINCPHVPFSSDLGIKLTKESHAIPLKTHVRKIERLERYMRPNLFNIRHATDGPFEVTYSKSTEGDHIYKFPTKTHRGQGQLSRKARFLLERYCRPCTVKLDRMQIAIPWQTALSATEIVHEQTCQKENMEHKIDLKREARVVSSDKLKGSIAMYKCLGDTNTAPPSPNIVVPKSFVAGPELPPGQQPTVPVRNSILKTLTPRNENAVSFKKPTEPVTKCENVVNASVILTPINDFFGLQRSVSKLTQTRSDDDTNRNRSSRKPKVGRVEKKRGNSYYPRRISPRLKLGTDSSPVKVM